MVTKLKIEHLIVLSRVFLSLSLLPISVGLGISVSRTDLLSFNSNYVKFSLGKKLGDARVDIEQAKNLADSISQQKSCSDIRQLAKEVKIEATGAAKKIDGAIESISE